MSCCLAAFALLAAPLGVGDILEEFAHLDPTVNAPAPGPSPDRPPLTDEEAMVIDRLAVEPVHIDDLARRLGLEARRLSGLLLQLELKGWVTQSPGKRFALAAGTRGK